MISIGETRRRLCDRFREHLRDVEKNDNDKGESKSVEYYVNLEVPNHSHHNMIICGVCLRSENRESIQLGKEKY